MSLYYHLLIPRLITLFVWYTGETINNYIWRRSVWGSHCDSTLHEVSCLLVHPRAHFSVIRSQNFTRCKTSEIGPHTVTLEHLLVLPCSVCLASRRVSPPQIFLLRFYLRLSHPPCMLTLRVFGDGCSLYIDILFWCLYFHSSFRYLSCSARY